MSTKIGIKYQFLYAYCNRMRGKWQEIQTIDDKTIDDSPWYAAFGKEGGEFLHKTSMLPAATFIIELRAKRL